MKQCPTCLENYEDVTLNFCLADGTPLGQTRDQADMETVVIPYGISTSSPKIVRDGVSPVFAYVAVGLIALVIGGGIVFWFKSDTSKNEVKATNSGAPLPNSSNTQADPIQTTQTNQNEVKVSDSSLKTGSGNDKTYSNPRFGYSLTYPSDIFEAQPVSANGDGREFLSADRQAKMLVYGTENADRQTLAGKYNDEVNKAGRNVTYKVLKGGFFAVSGFDGADIFYQKTSFRNNEFMTFTITYPAAQRNIYDRITTRVSKSFR